MFYPAMPGHARFTVTGKAAGRAMVQVCRATATLGRPLQAMDDCYRRLIRHCRAVMGVMDSTLAAAGSSRVSLPCAASDGIADDTAASRTPTSANGGSAEPAQPIPSDSAPPGSRHPAISSCRTAHRRGSHRPPPEPQMLAARAAVLMRTQVYEPTLAPDGRPDL